MGIEAPHILVVDDDERLRGLLKKFLSENGFIVATASDAADARKRLESLDVDLLVLDVMMPGETGIEFAEDYRKKSDTPILMLTAMGETEDRIKGLETGVDDYLTKPFEPRELLLRIHSILRRMPSKEALQETISLGAVLFDPIRAELKKDNESIRLTDIEAQLLQALAERPGDIFSRDELAEYTGASGEGRAVDVQVTRLRRKIEADPKNPRYLQTVRGQGYTLKPD